MPAPNRNAAKRDAIRRAALDVFLRRGYTNASVDEIVTESGVSRQTVYNNFGGKEGLFLAVVDDVLDRFLAAMTAVVDEVALGESDDLPRDLTRLGAGWVALALQPDMAGLRRLIVGEASAFPNLAAEWRDRGPDRAQAMLRREFERLAERGRIDLGQDPALTVMLYSQSVLLIPNQLVLLSAQMSPDQEMIDRYVGEAVAMFLARYGATTVPGHLSRTPSPPRPDSRCGALRAAG
jgi:TetR/AcrR family transcriptional regulator, mexJK operon transcriptional repressor